MLDKVKSIIFRNKLNEGEVRVRAQIASISNRDSSYEVKFRTTEGEELSFDIEPATIVSFKDINNGRLVYNGKEFVSFK